MFLNVNQSLAQQIVQTVKDVCGQDVNFIDQYGIIFASTDAKRIGTFHEIGYKAFHTGTAIEVDNDNTFTGTHRGINLPVYHNQSVLAVIGITGEPQSVNKYAHLAERITLLLIREQEINALSRNQADKKHFMIHSLIGKQNVNKHYLNESLEDFGIDLEKEKRLILVRLDHRFHPGNASMIETQISQMFEMAGIRLYTFDYPNEYLAIIDADAFEQNQSIFQKFCSNYPDILKITVGKATSVYDLRSSYQSALTAWKSIASEIKNFALFDDLTLEIILSAVDEESKEAFQQKTIGKLSDDETAVLKTYFENDMSLSKTCEQLFIHKNTLQYKLNRIHQKCGFNPRVFKDAVLLYLAVFNGDFNGAFNGARHH